MIAGAATRAGELYSLNHHAPGNDQWPRDTSCSYARRPARTLAETSGVLETATPGHILDTSQRATMLGTLSLERIRLSSVSMSAIARLTRTTRLFPAPSL